MKKVTGILLTGLLVLSLIGCGGSDNEPPASPQPPSGGAAVDGGTHGGSGEIGDGSNVAGAAALESLTASYYAGQDDRAFQMFQKSIFKNLADDWTSEDTNAHPVWNYDSFARYDILDGGMTSVAPEEDLYYCTFSSANGKTGYVVLSYNGDSIGKVSLSETAYPYDLRINSDAMADALSKLEIDLPTASASRVRITDVSDADGGLSFEAIRVTDGGGHDVLCYFGHDSITVEPDLADL